VAEVAGWVVLVAEVAGWVALVAELAGWLALVAEVAGWAALVADVAGWAALLADAAGPDRDPALKSTTRYVASVLEEATGLRVAISPWQTSSPLLR
jgi:hypothetical protein